MLCKRNQNLSWLEWRPRLRAGAADNKPGMHTVTKTWQDLPAAHRQPKHDGHCRLIHGHDWRFDITFNCAQLDESGFVIDVGKLGKVKEFLIAHFDHTLLLNADDSQLEFLTRGLTSTLEVIPGGVGEEDYENAKDPLAKIVIVPNCGMEGLAKYVFDVVQGMMMENTWEGRAREVRVQEVTCWEDSKNRATYTSG